MKHPVFQTVSRPLATSDYLLGLAIVASSSAAAQAMRPTQGLDHTRLRYYHNGIERRLTDVHGRVIAEVLA
jgi:hypothetical protein